MNILKLTALLLLATVIASCSRKNKQVISDSVVMDTPVERDTIDKEVSFALNPDEEDYSNSVKGHKESNRIIGNFTGLGIDTIYIIDRIDYSKLKEEGEDPEYISPEYISPRYLIEHTHFYAHSNNPKIPDIEIYGYWGAPGLVYEGDLDRDGKDEWGFLPVGMSSQWRTYRVLNYDSRTKSWRHLYYGPDDFYAHGSDNPLSTPYYVRESGVDLIEKGPRKGLIKINYGAFDGEIHDTIVKPTYTPITPENW